MSYVLTPLPIPTVPVADGVGMFPVHRIYCVGRNYAEHAKEMGFSDREPPFFFMKPADAVVPVAPGTTVELRYPLPTTNLHHEIELVIAIGRAGRNIKAANAQAYVYGYAVGLDMTRRDQQFAMRDKGRPWEIGKAFDQSAPIGPIHPASRTGELSTAAITLKVNGEVRQSSDISQLIWNVHETIEHLSSYFELQPGDLIYTGTPAGVGAVKPGDLMEGAIAGLGDLKVKIIDGQR